MKYSLSLYDLEIQLQKRLKIPYSWNGKKQNNHDDTLTNFIYHSPCFLLIQSEIEKLPKPLQSYAWNRWYNFWSAKGVESIFTQQKNIFPEANSKNTERDFYIDSVPFDHKTTVFPKGFKKNFDYAQKNPEELVQWLYENQSQQQRKHWKNRFFIVLFDSHKGEHWKVKSQLLLLHKKISKELQSFSLDKCVCFNKNGEKRYAGIIWIQI